MTLQFLSKATVSQVSERIQELHGASGYERSEAEILTCLCVGRQDALVARRQAIDNALACTHNRFQVFALREERRRVENELEIIEKMVLSKNNFLYKYESDCRA